VVLGLNVFCATMQKCGNITCLSSNILRNTLLYTLLFLVLALSHLNFKAWTIEPYSHHIWRTNSQAVFSPPMMKEIVPENAYILYDIRHRTQWTYGTGHLFRFAYLSMAIREEQLSERDDEKQNIYKILEWLKTPEDKRFYFCTAFHSEQVWRDCSAYFPHTGAKRVQKYMKKLESKNGRAAVIKMLSPHESLLEDFPEFWAYLDKEQ
jgi:hypothetical protein